MSDSIDNGNVTLQEIFNNLTYGELSQYSIGGAQEGAIQPGDYPKVMSAINRGVQEIQKDLELNENTVHLRMLEGIITYPIHSKHSVVGGSHQYKFVWDSEFDRFEDDIFRIRQVYDKKGRELPLNKRNRSDTLYIPQHNVIQNPFPKEGDILAVVYTRLSKPIQGIEAEEDLADVYLPIPDHTLNALYAYVASLMTAGITTQQEISDSQVWRQEYEYRIAKLKSNPAIERAEHINTKLTDRGFV